MTRTVASDANIARAALALTLAVLFMPLGAAAAGLGNLHVYSSLGEPLDAEIDLHSVGRAETISARPASQWVYKRENVDANAILPDVQVRLQRRPNGQLYLRATTSRPVNEPIVELLIELDDSTRRARGVAYTLLLNPPGATQFARKDVPQIATSPAPSPATPPSQKPAPPMAAAPPAAPPAVGELALIPPPTDLFPKPRATAEAALESPRFAINRYELEGASRLDPRTLQNALREFTGPSKDFAAIQSAVAALERLYSDSGLSATRVIVPEQDIENGVVRLRLVEATVRNVEVTGQQHYSVDNIRRSLPALREGLPPDINEIGSSLRLANESTSKYAQITFKQTERPDRVDAVVRVADAQTRRVALSLDNTGTTQTGYWRLGVAYQDANLWDLDHAFGLQYVTSPVYPRDVIVIAGTYRVPLYALGGALDFVAGHSSVNSGTVNTPTVAFGIKGAGDFVGARYTHLLPKVGAWDQRLALGLDFRYFKNDVLLTGATQSLVPNFQTMPVNLTYSGFIRNAPTEWNASVGVSRNIPVGANGTTQAFQRPGGRANAEADYTILRYTAEIIQSLPAEWRARGFITGQRTRDALIPGEQLALGGMDYVRGFAERAVANDYGDRAALELITPAWSGPLTSQSRALVFLDGGVVRRNKALPGEITSTHIASTGLGLRMNIATSAQIRVDAAYVLSGDPQYPRGTTRTHARLLYLF